MKRNFIVSFISLLFSMLVGIIFCEIYFYTTHGDFFKNKSLHFGQQANYEIRLKKRNEKVFVVNKKCEGVYEKVELPEGQNFDGYFVVFGAWVKSSTPKAVRLVMFNNGRKISVKSPYHSGGGRWEYLVVSEPIQSKMFETLITSKGTSFQYKKSDIILRPPRKVAMRSGQPFYYEVGFKKREKINIAVFGGSTSFGVGVLPEEGLTYPFILQHMFDSLRWSVEVENYGIQGSKVRSVFDLLESGIAKPDIVLVVPVWNDSGELLFDRYLNYRVFSPEIIKFMETTIFNRIAIGYYIKLAMVKINNIFYLKNQALVDKEPSIVKPDKVQLHEEFYNTLDRLVKKLLGNNIDVILLNLPYFGSRKNNLPFNIPEAYIKSQCSLPPKTFLSNIALCDEFYKMDDMVLRKVAKENSVSYFRIGESKAFKSIPYDERFTYFCDAIHFYSAGNKIVAGEIFMHILPQIFKRLNKEAKRYDRLVQNLSNSSCVTPNKPNKVNLANSEIFKRNKGFELNNFLGYDLHNGFIINANYRIGKQGLFDASSHGKGILRSKPFIINGNYIHFLIEGGIISDKTLDNSFFGVKIINNSNKSLIASISPKSRSGMKDVYLDVSQAMGDSAYIEVVSNSNSSVAVDDFSIE